MMGRESERKASCLCLALLALAHIGACTVCAQTGARFAIAQSVVAGGGSSWVSGPRFQLAGTIAQPSTSAPSANRFSVQGGFWIWPAPIVFAPAKIGDSFVLSFHSEPGKWYIVQFADSLSEGNWASLPSVLGNGATVTVTNSAAGRAQRFFRLLEH